MKKPSSRASSGLDWRKLKLWEHQRRAIATCESFISSWRGGSSALIHHPTGSGKSGIMAVTSAINLRRGSALIVCPSDALVEQLITELQEKFWRRIGADDAWLLPNTVRLYPRTAANLAEEIEKSPRVVCGTIQALQQIHGNPEYASLVGRFAVVMFDEGHREPAPLWAAAVRGLAAPTVLFSATPYRNDYKLFQIDAGFVDFLSFQKAATQGLIRPVTVIEQELPSTPRLFVRQIVGIRDDMVRKGRLQDGDKVIIRADNEQSVHDLWTCFCAELRERPERALSVHDNFKWFERDGHIQAADVPPGLRARKETFLIHQFKLTEGIDDPNCRLLALFNAFGSERQLVQQIGRLTRHPGPIGTPTEPALVLSRPSERVADSWRRFIHYDQSCIDNNDLPPIRNAEVMGALLDAFPETDYVSGKFRRRVDFNSEALIEDLCVPCSATVYETRKSFDFDAFGQAVDRALIETDREIVYAGKLPHSDCAYRASVRFIQSPYLGVSLFQSANLELTVFTRLGKRLFFYDSAGLSIADHPDLRDRVAPRVIASLLPKGERNIVSSLTLHNTDLSPLALRARSLRARNLDRSGIFMGEQSHVATVATGYKGAVRRSLNLARGRVREMEGKFVSLGEHLTWCRGIAKELDAATEPARLFNRFAAQMPPPDDPTPLNILLDLWEFSDRFVDEHSRPVTFDFEGVCVDVRPAANGPAGFPFMFDLTVNQTTVPVYLKYDAEKKKYWIKASDLSHLKDRHNDNITLAARLNQAQPFRIIVDAKTVYAYGRFYSVSLDLRKRDGPGATVLGLLTAVDGIETAVSEKGDLTAAAKTWPRTSLFGFIDANLRVAHPVFGQPLQGLVCDDLGDEAGDFIGYAQVPSPRVCLIAAKWKPGAPGAGASQLYDVVAQTLKNLIFLKSDGDPLPGAATKFDHDWKLGGGRVPRCRLGPSSLTFRRQFAQLRAAPSTRKEAWLVLGGGLLSKQKVEAAFRATEPAPHTIQLFHLLLSLYSTCQSVGVEPRIYCAS